MDVASLIAAQYRDYELEGGLPISAFDIDSCTGVDIIKAVTGSNITVDTVKLKDAGAEIDWIIDCCDLFCRHVIVGDLVVIEVACGLIDVVKTIKDNCFVWTKAGWGWLVDRNVHCVEVDGILRT